MKYVWEATDFDNNESTAHGMMVSKNNNTETWMVGYQNGSGKNIVLISLSDGMVSPVGNPQIAAAELNDRGYVPIFQRLLVDTRPSIILAPSKEEPGQ